MASLPPELWLQVFPNLKNNDLRSAALVCSDFRYLAQPLLFSVLDVSPFFLSYNADRPVRRPQSYLDRHVERLAVYQRPHIIHGVRHCWISPYSRHGFPERSNVDDLDPCLVINHLINALHTFPNLRTLSWHCIDITPEWWLSLHALPLHKLWINSSLVLSNPDDPNSVDLPPLPSITHLDLDQWPWEGQVTNHVSIHEERAHGIDLTTLGLIIHPESTHSISVPRVDTACRLLTTLSAAMHDLRTLRIPFCSLASPDFVPALEQCGHLRTLSILPPSPDERARTLRLPEIPERVVPNLVAYEGPCINVLDFATTRSLERLSLWGFDQLPVLYDPVSSLSETLAALEAQTPCVRSLKSLQVVVMCVDRPLLDAVAGFRGLEEVFIQSQDSSSSNSGGVRRMPSSTHLPGSNMPVSNLYALLLSTSFPASLRRLKLDTRLNGTKLSLEHQEQDAAQFMESFAAQNACLRKVEIAYGVYWTGIYTAVWGRLRPNYSSKKDKGKGRQHQQHWVPHMRQNEHSHGPPLSSSLPPASAFGQPSSSGSSPVPILASPVSLPNLNGTLRPPHSTPSPSPSPSPNHLLAPPTPLSCAPTESEISTHIAQEAITGYSTSKSSRHCLMSTVVSSVHPGYLGRLVFTVHRRTILFPPSGAGSAGAGIDGRSGGVEEVEEGPGGVGYVRRSASRSPVGPGRMGSRVLRERRSFGLFGSVNAGTSANLNWHGKEEGYLASFWGRVKRMFGVLH